MDLLSRNLCARLKGKTAWITGGRRIGRTVALALAGQGVNIAASWRSSEREALETVRRAKRAGVRALAVRADVSSREDSRRAAGAIREEFGALHILVNLASVFSPVEVSRVSEPDWEANVSAHILGSFWPAQAAVPLMPRGSHIINIADRTSIGKIYPGYVPYVATKAAVASLTRALAVEYGPKGIYDNAIAPGPVLRPADVSPSEWRRVRRSVLEILMSDREASEQFALLVLYLAAATGASGHVYPLDFGKNL